MAVVHYRSIFPNYIRWMSNTIMIKVEIIPIQSYRRARIPTNRFRSVPDIWQVKRTLKEDGWDLVSGSGLSNVYGSPIVALAGAPLTTFSALTNGAIHFPSSSRPHFSFFTLLFRSLFSFNSNCVKFQSISSTICNCARLSNNESNERRNDPINDDFIAIVSFDFATTSACNNEFNKSVHFPLHIHVDVIRRCLCERNDGRLNQRVTDW